MTTNHVEDDVDDFLAHYGVLGMHWGQHKPGVVVAKKPTPHRKTKREIAERNRRKTALQKRRTLSDEELNRLVARLQTEKKLKDLHNEDLHKGRLIVGTVLATVGTAVATVALTGAAKYGIKAALTKSFSLKDAAKYIIPAPKK